MHGNIDVATELGKREDIPKFFGWVQRPDEVEKVLAGLPMPLAQSVVPALDENKEVLLYDIFRQVVGRDEYQGPQKIGDCVGHGWKRGVDYTAVVQIHMQLISEFGQTLSYDSPDVNNRKGQLLEEFQEASCEAIYALSRCEVGGQWNSMSDGSVGAWAAKAVSTFGTISWKALAAAGYGDSYDPNRAKQWGAKGLPDKLEPSAKTHLIKNVSLVKSFKEAAALIQNGYIVPVCSNRGFTMTRDNQGFCSPSGVWNHCMMFGSVRWDRPGLLCHQNWGKNTPSGPLYKNQPDNTFWVDANVCDYMLNQEDSFSPSVFQGYPIQNLLTWAH
jgi:hypothetical protein